MQQVSRGERRRKEKGEKGGKLADFYIWYRRHGDITYKEGGRIVTKNRSKTCMTYRNSLKTAPAARYVPGRLPLVGSPAGCRRSPGPQAAIRDVVADAKNSQP